MKRYQKILLGAAAALLIIIGGMQVYFSFFLDEQLKQVVINRFDQATDETYSLDIGTFEIEVIGRQLRASDIKLSKKADQGTNFSATFEEFEISGIGFWNLLWSRQLNMRRIELKKPSIHITESVSNAEKYNSSKELINWSKKLSRISLQVFENVTVPTLIINDLSLEYSRDDLPVKPYFSFRDAQIRLQQIVIDSTLIKDQRVIPANAISTTIRDVQFHTANELYTLSADQAGFNSEESRFFISKLQLKPRYPKRKFALKVGHETDRITLAVDNISAENVNSEKLNRAEGLEARHIAITKPELHIFRDKHLPFPPNNNPPLPQQAVTEIPFATAIDSITISKGEIEYEELQLQSDRPGSVTFTDLQATIANLTNIQKSWSSDRPLIFEATTQIMGRAKLDAQFTFPMNSDRHFVKGSLQSMDMHHLNGALEPLAFVRIDDGKINSMFFNMSFGPKTSSGSVELRYEDLKISVLNKGGNDENFGSKLTSVLANTFKVKSGNTGSEIRVGNVSFERDDQKSVFNYWWKSLLSGLKSSIGL